MSGPKDFIVLFEAARLLQIEARHRAEQRARRAATEARLAQQRKIAEKRIAEMAARRAAIEAESRRRAAATHADVVRQRETIAQRTAERLAQTQSVSGRRGTIDRNDENLQDIDADITTSKPTSSESSISAAVSDACAVIEQLSELSDVQAQSVATKLSSEIEKTEGVTTAGGLQILTRIQGNAKQEYDAAVDRARRLPELVQKVMCWQAELPADEAVSHFCHNPASAWQTQATSLLNDHSAGHAVDVLLERCQNLVAQAEQISHDAGAKQAAFATRNELLADVVSSLQEIGFFVSDPQFENPSDPAGPVLVKATRGREEVAATVDLTDTIRSTWNGIGEEHCKDAFFQYVDQMQAKGIEIKPTRADLQDRPKLKQKGARSLPNSEQQRGRN